MRPLTPEALVEAIDAANTAEAEGRRKDDKPRCYIGASSIGTKCDAYLCLSLRGFPDVTPMPRLLRIFKLGHVIEELVLDDLRAAKLAIVEEHDWKQKEFTAFEGHVKAHADGQVLFDKQGAWRLEDIDFDILTILEIKSMNRANFDRFKSEGVKHSHPKYYEQMQLMMGMSKYPYALFVSYCKDDSDYWAEIVAFDDDKFQAQLARSEIAIRNEGRRCSDDPQGFTCSGCFKRDGCWGFIEINPRCSRCAYSNAAKHKTWHCTKHDKTVPATSSCEHFKPFKPKG